MGRRRQRTAPSVASLYATLGRMDSSPEWPDVATAEFWESRYAEGGHIWSGRANETVVDIVGEMNPGRALDVACGEGADTIWMALHGWDATGIDVSPTAIERARAASEAAGADAVFVAADLSTWEEADRYDLVTASFLHSPAALDRISALRSSAGHVAPGGRLLVVSHAGPPSWAPPGHGDGHAFPKADEELAALALDPAGWAADLTEARTRTVTAPDGSPGKLEDAVLLLRRLR